MNSRADSSGQIGFADISQSVTRIPTSTFASKAKLGLRFLTFILEVCNHKSYDYIGWMDSIFYSDFLTFFLACTVTFYLTFFRKLASILTFSLLYLASFQAFILAWHSFWHSLWHSLWHSFWHSIWHLFWYPVWHSNHCIIWHSFWPLAEDRRGPLWSWASCAGLAGNTAI